jgi:hypothetical protein
VHRLGVEPQEVVPGQAESADARFESRLHEAGTNCSDEAILAARQREANAHRPNGELGNRTSFAQPHQIAMNAIER